MAVKTAVVLLALALAIRGSSAVQQGLVGTALNTVCDQALGVPCTVAGPSSISNPPTPPTEAPSESPIVAPITLPPISLPLPPITLPPIVLPPIEIPTVPSQAPGPVSGAANGLLYFYSNRTLTAEDLEKLADLINKQLKNVGSVLFTPGTVTTILGTTTTTIVATASDILSCPDFAAVILSYSSFIADANAEGIPLTYVSLTKVTCLGAGIPIDINLAAPPPPSIAGTNALGGLDGLLG